jgi:hypothetical protein
MVKLATKVFLETCTPQFLPPQKPNKSPLVGFGLFVGLYVC